MLKIRHSSSVSIESECFLDAVGIGSAQGTAVIPVHLFLYEVLA